MLRFNGMESAGDETDTAFQYILCYGSTAVQSAKSAHGRIFQYILCYGSTLHTAEKIDRLFHFNTSYVTVQQL